MSIAAIESVLKHSRSRLGARLVLISLANYANEAREAYPSVSTIAREAHLSVRAAQYALRDLEGLGEILKVGRSKYGTTVYKITIEGVQDLQGAEFAGVQNTTQGVKLASPEPLNEPLDKKPSAVTRAEARYEENSTGISFTVPNLRSMP